MGGERLFAQRLHTHGRREALCATLIPLSLRKGGLYAPHSLPNIHHGTVTRAGGRHIHQGIPQGTGRLPTYGYTSGCIQGGIGPSIASLVYIGWYMAQHSLPGVYNGVYGPA